MYRTLYVFQTEKGYLTENRTTTDDPFEAITFVDIDSACKRLVSADGLFGTDIKIQPVQAQFPKPLNK